MGVSLLRNAGPAQSLLLVAGQREYEDVAVDLVSTSRGREVLKRIRASLRQGRKRGVRRSQREDDENAAPGDRPGVGVGSGPESLPIFDTEAITTDLNRAFMLMSDVHDAWNDGLKRAGGKGDVRLPHIVLTGKTLSGESPSTV